MVTIGAFAIAIAALLVMVYCEYYNYWFGDTRGPGDGGNTTETGGDGAGSNLQKLAALTSRFQVEHKNVSGISGKLRAIWQFADFVLFKSKEQKLEQIRLNELTAEKLLLEYQALVRLPGNERVDRFIQWRDDVAHFEEKKKVEFPFRTAGKNNLA